MAPVQYCFSLRISSSWAALTGLGKVQIMWVTTCESFCFFLSFCWQVALLFSCSSGFPLYAHIYLVKRLVQSLWGSTITWISISNRAISGLLCDIDLLFMVSGLPFPLLDQINREIHKSTGNLIRWPLLLLNRDRVAYQSTAAAAGGINLPGASAGFQIETPISLSARWENSQWIGFRESRWK